MQGKKNKLLAVLLVLAVCAGTFLQGGKASQAKSKYDYIKNSSYKGFYCVEDDFQFVNEEVGGYFIYINSIKKNKVTFKVYYFGVNFSPIYESNKITATIKKNKAKFDWTDSWSNSGHGTITFLKDRKVKLKMIEKVTSELNRATLAMNATRFEWIHT